MTAHITNVPSIAGIARLKRESSRNRWLLCHPRMGFSCLYGTTRREMVILTAR